MTSCCTPVIFAWFRKEGLHKLGLRHRGPRCAGQVDEIAKAPWLSRRQALLTGQQIVVVE
jgi:hypothetical protein